MTNSEKFDPATLMDGVKERIKATFVALISDEHWDELVRTEITTFFAPHGGGYYTAPALSDFQQTVRRELEVFVRERVKAHLAEYATNRWDAEGRPLVNDALQKLLAEAAPQMLESVIKSVLGQALQQMNWQMR